jgi:acyl-coenzyme A thioesterase PaaI-like protein
MESLPVLNPAEFPHCFVCGPSNPEGLHLIVHRDGDEAVAVYTPRGTHQGYPGRFHGGLVGLLVDEMLVYAGAARGLWGMTAKVNYSLRAPIGLDDELHLRSRVTSTSSRAFRATVEIRVSGEALAAEGEGLCVMRQDLVPNEQGEQ